MGLRWRARVAEGQPWRCAMSWSVRYRSRELIDSLLADPRQLGPDYQPIHGSTTTSCSATKPPAAARPAPSSRTRWRCSTAPARSGSSSASTGRFAPSPSRTCWRAQDLALHLTPEPETFDSLCPPRFAGLMSPGQPRADDRGRGPCRGVRPTAWRSTPGSARSGSGAGRSSSPMSPTTRPRFDARRRCARYRADRPSARRPRQKVTNITAYGGCWRWPRTAVRRSWRSASIQPGRPRRGGRRSARDLARGGLFGPPGPLPDA